MRIVQIHSAQLELNQYRRQDILDRFYSTVALSGWEEVVSSAPGGRGRPRWVSPGRLFWVTRDWSEADLEELRRMWPVSTILLELEDEDADDLYTRIENGSIPPAVPVVENV